MKTTDELLQEYRSAYGLEESNQSPQINNPFDEPLSPDFSQKLEQDQATAIDWMYKTQGMDADPAYIDNNERRAKFDHMLETNPFVQANKDKLMQALDGLREEINNPDSPIDLDTASKLFIKLFNEEVMSQAKGDKK